MKIKIRVLLIEDNQLLRDGIASVLENQKDIKILTVSKRYENLITKIARLKPNVILLDLGLRNRNSLTIVELVKKDFPDANIIMMDLAPVPADVNLFLKAGASGFILKDTTPDDFLSTIRAVAEGTKVLPSNLNQSLFSQIVEHAVKGKKVKLSAAVRMTKDEREIIKLIGSGLSNIEIGKKLGVSTITVKGHIHNIMKKLALHTRLEVVNHMQSKKSVKMNNKIKLLTK